MTFDDIMLAIGISVFVLVNLFILWALNECRKIEQEIMRKAIENPELRDAASALWCAPKSWRKKD